MQCHFFPLPDIYHIGSARSITRLDVTSTVDIETFVLNDNLYFVATNGSTNNTQNEVKIFSWVRLFVKHLCSFH